MRELEEVYCEVRRVINLQHLVLDRLNNIEEDEYGSSVNAQDYDGMECSLGGFLNGAAYAWMSHGCHLMVINTKTGENVSCGTFRERITCVCEFPTQFGQLPLLLIGLDNGSNRIKDSMGLLCVFDCATSRVLRAIRTPAGVEQVCVVSGGTDWEEFGDKRVDNIFSEMDGVACVVLRNLQHIMVDLRRSSWYDADSASLTDESSPAELDVSLVKSSVAKNCLSKEKHVGYNLLNNSIERYINFNRKEFQVSSLLMDNLTSALISSAKIGCLISGCMGRVLIWQNNGSIGWISTPVDGKMAVTHLALLEPTDDPRPFYYLWVVYQEESLRSAPILRMYALLFERKYCDKGTNLYFNLEAEPSLRFEFELDKGDKVINLSPIEREINPEQTDSNAKRGEANLLLIGTIDRMLLFDLNQWYKEQMPQSIYDCQNPNSILAVYRTNSEGEKIEKEILSYSYVPSTLRELPNNRPCSPEELFYPSSLSFEWLSLSTSKLMLWITRGVQAELLREMAVAGPVVLIRPTEVFHKCLSAGLVPFNTDTSYINDENAQREMLLSLCLEQRWTTFLLRCAKEWLDGSATYLYPSFLKWGAQRATSIKMIADRLCVPLFDQSGSSIGEGEIRTLRFCSQQLECLSNVVAKLSLDSEDMIRQRRALKRVSVYLQVLLWFYDVGLLPETQDVEEGRPPLAVSLSLRIPYPYEKLASLYKEKRNTMKRDERFRLDDEGLFIDVLINKECATLKCQWKTESGGDVKTDGYYPPPSLQSLLRSYLVDCYRASTNESECKHQITIYLLMDLAMLLQGSYPGVDQLIKYPSAFKMSPSLIKLTQAFWLLDHEDYQGFLDIMIGQLVSDCDVKDWHHKHALTTLIRNGQEKLALIYLRIRKPPVSSIDDQSTIINLCVEHGLVQSAFHRRPPFHYAQLLICFFGACRTYDRLGDILHLALQPEEEEVLVKFLEENKLEGMKTLYYLQRCRYAEIKSKDSLTHYKGGLCKSTLPTAVAMLTAYDTTLPAVTKCFSADSSKVNLNAELEFGYPRPMSHNKCKKKQQSIHETVIKKARETYVRKDKCRIPFVTAPCASLKAAAETCNVNNGGCILFATPAQKQSRNKRTFDGIIEEEEDSKMLAKEENKCKKVRVEVDEEQEEVSKKKRHLEMNVAFETPLVKRKSRITCNEKGGTSMETPHSILKIRQLIHNSASSNISSAHAVESDKFNSSTEKERKINRQIRFNIGHLKTDTDGGSGDDGNVSKEEEGEEHCVRSMDTSAASTDVFYSPSAGVKSYNETTRLLSDSSCFDESPRYPRPRASLRRISERYERNVAVIPQSSSFSSTDDRKRVSLSTEEHRTLKARNSISNISTYSTTLLSSDSSFDYLDTSLVDMEKRGSASSIDISFLSRQDANAISSTPLMTSNKMKKLIAQDATLSPTQVAEITDQKTMDNSIDEQHMKEQNVHSQRELTERKGATKVQNETLLASIREDGFEEYEIPSNGLEKAAKLMNNADITDDESSNDSSRIILTLEESDNEVNVHSLQHLLDAPSNDAGTQKRQKEKLCEQAVSNEGRQRSQRASNSSKDHASSVADIADCGSSQPTGTKVLERKEEVTPPSTPFYRRTRSSSVASDVNLSNAVTSEENCKECVIEKRITRRAASVQKELPDLSKLLRQEPKGLKGSKGSKGSKSLKGLTSSTSSASVGKMEQESIAKHHGIISRRKKSADVKDTKEKPSTSRLTRSASLAPEAQERKKEISRGRVPRTRGSSVPKELNGMNAKSNRRSITVISDASEERQDDVAILTRNKRRTVASSSSSSSSSSKLQSDALSVDSPAKNTRSRRSSTQSVPDELEEILNSSLTNKSVNVLEKESVAIATRRRRAASVDLSQLEVKKKTRSLRSTRNIIEEAILEEPSDVEVQTVDLQHSNDEGERNSKKKSTTYFPDRKQVQEKALKDKSKKKKKEKMIDDSDNNGKFFFSHPEKADVPPLHTDVGRVPCYVFSPPQTRSRNSSLKQDSTTKAQE